MENNVASLSVLRYGIALGDISVSRVMFGGTNADNAASDVIE